MKVEVRKARLKDVPEVIKLWKEFMKDHDKIVLARNKKLKPYLEKRKDAPKSMERYIKGIIRSRNGGVYIAEVDREPAGFTIFWINKNPPVYKILKVGYVTDIFIKKQFRGLGISTQFRKIFTKFFKDKGIKHISMSVFPENKKALSIYHRWGYFDYQISVRKKI
ncbi:GNAT family N-acetyltransferase [Candidatus Woesearchaeota archaeon]|nr:GNAT family N-acetyltransferase [Candidatus Woesearchaeota archaeon]